jgi:hypothetical protein
MAVIHAEPQDGHAWIETMVDEHWRESLRDMPWRITWFAVGKVSRWRAGVYCMSAWALRN